ncbi:hypothetical protein [Spirosoma koreense]
MTESLFDEFEAYTENRMVPPQLDAFEARLEQDSAMRLALADYQRFRHSIEAIKLKQQLVSIHDRLDQRGELAASPPATRFSVSWGGWTRLAIAAVVILVAGYGLLRVLRPTPAEQTFLTYYQPEPVPRGMTACGPQLTPGISAYRSGNYERALVGFRQLPASEPCVAYYIGLAQLALGNAPAAITSLNRALDATNAPDLISRKAEWYLALAYLKADRATDTRKLLIRISDQPEHPFQQIAKKALADLEHE